jgi:molybdopterin-containing oxidoreductase family membrane subunit
MADRGVIAVFEDPDRAAHAVEALRRAGLSDVRARMPAPFPELMEALGPPSRLGWGTFTGGMLGIAGGFALTIGTSLAWPLVVGGKEIASVPPYVVIALECCILLGAFATLAELVARLAGARRRDPAPCDVRFSSDRIGILVRSGDFERAERILRDSGAEEVERVA